MIPPIPKTIVRPEQDTGMPDDIVVQNTDIHLEQMDHDFWWMGCYRDDKRICFHFVSDSPIKVIVTEDELGAVDDTRSPPVSYKQPPENQRPDIDYLELWRLRMFTGELREVVRRLDTLPVDEMTVARKNEMLQLKDAAEKLINKV